MALITWGSNFVLVYILTKVGYLVHFENFSSQVLFFDIICLRFQKDTSKTEVSKRLQNVACRLKTVKIFVPGFHTVATFSQTDCILSIRSQLIGPLAISIKIFKNIHQKMNSQTILKCSQLPNKTLGDTPITRGGEKRWTCLVFGKKILVWSYL